MNRTLRIGFIGSGFNAKFHIRALVHVRNCVVSGIVGSKPDSKSAQAAKSLAISVGVADPHITVYRSVEEMASDEGIDAIWITAPNYTRIANMTAICAGNATRLKSGKAPLAGVACEKPLARNIKEAKHLVDLANNAGIKTGYLENQVFSPALSRGKEIIWSRAAKKTGRPYLARAAEEHSGPHEPWFWSGRQQGGGVLTDMLCHSTEAARFLLTEPGKPRDSLSVVAISATVASLKWSSKTYAVELKESSGGLVDYTREPAEDYAHATITYKDDKGNTVISEQTASWSYVGPGLRLSFELLGPEYSLKTDTLNSGLNIFMSRRVQGAKGEDMVEKQNSEQGLMPIIPEEESVYGYVGEDRHFVNCFLSGSKPDLTFNDGLEVIKLLMACYKSAETGVTVNPADHSLEDYQPKVSKGEWKST